LVKENAPASADFQRGEDLFNSNQKKDSAFFYFTRVTENSKDSLLIAMSYNYMAMIQNDAGDYFGGQESGLEALRHLNEKDQQHIYCIASVYNELGVSNAGLKQYQLAIEYYDQAIRFQQEEMYRNIFLNNKAVACKLSGNYRQAIQILQSLLEKQKGDPLSYARALTNLASARWFADPSYYPVPEFMEALRIRKKEGYNIGIASSYNHLSDYYLSHYPDSAFLYARDMYGLAKLVNSADQKLDALKKLVSLAPGYESKQYFKQYQQLSDSIITARNQAKNQFALIKYQAERNKAENLLLQKENSQKQLKIFRQRVWMWGLLGTAGIVFIILIWQFKRKQQQLRWTSQAKIKEHELRTSQKVHDTVANGLYRIMSEIQYKEGLNKEELLDKVEQLYERSRDISYEPNSQIQSPQERIKQIANSFAREGRKISLVGNEEVLWQQITEDVLKELEYVLNELMVNMAKHSQANHVVIRFYMENGYFVMNYRDDGIGFPENLQPGNGLISTGNRIHRIGGEFILAAESASGASIKITIPISIT
jgi:signal transduction histidine kinase